jgi:hypothetical protein
MVRKIAIKAATVAVALGTSAASAETVKLTDAQMDQVTAGVWVLITNAQWVGYLGQQLYISPGVYWLEPQQTPPPGFAQLPPATTPVALPDPVIQPAPMGGGGGGGGAGGGAGG